MKTQRDGSDGSTWPAEPLEGAGPRAQPSGLRHWERIPFCCLKLPCVWRFANRGPRKQAREAGEASCAPLHGAQGVPWTCPSPLASVPKSLSHSFLNTCRLSGPAVPLSAPAGAGALPGEGRGNERDLFLCPRWSRDEVLGCGAERRGRPGLVRTEGYPRSRPSQRWREVGGRERQGLGPMVAGGRKRNNQGTGRPVCGFNGRGLSWGIPPAASAFLVARAPPEGGVRWGGRGVLS